MKTTKEDPESNSAESLSSQVRAILLNEKATHHFDLSLYQYYFCRTKEENDNDVIENAYHQACHSFQNELIRFLSEKYENKIKNRFPQSVMDHLKQCCRHINKETAYNELYELTLCPSVELITKLNHELQNNPLYKPLKSKDSISKYKKQCKPDNFKTVIGQMETDLNKLSNHLCDYAYQCHLSITERILLRIKVIEKDLPPPNSGEGIETFLYRANSQIRNKT